MIENKKIMIFLVDDDAVYLKSLEIEFLEQADFVVETYATGERCIQNLSNKPDIIVLDYWLDGINANAMNGIDTLDKIKLINPDIPVIMLSAQDKIEVAVNCMHHKAFDYVVKGETAFIRLKKTINAIFELQNMERVVKWYKDRM